MNTINIDKLIKMQIDTDDDNVRMYLLFHENPSVVFMYSTKIKTFKTFRTLTQITKKNIEIVGSEFWKNYVRNFLGNKSIALDGEEKYIDTRTRTVIFNDVGGEVYKTMPKKRD